MCRKPELFKHILLILSVIVCSCSTAEKDAPVISRIFKGNRFLPEAVNRIYIDKITNENINITLTEALNSSLKRKINLGEKLAVVDSAEKSDMTLRIDLGNYSSEAVKYNSSGEVEVTKLRLCSYVWLISTQTGEEKIKNKKIESDFVYSEITPPVMNEFRAINSLADQMADRIISVVSTGWYVEKSNQKRSEE